LSTKLSDTRLNGLRGGDSADVEITQIGRVALIENVRPVRAIFSNLVLYVNLCG
jgi:hypothetical protein